MASSSSRSPSESFKHRYWRLRDLLSPKLRTLAGHLRTSVWLEFALLTLVAVPYSSGILNFDPELRLAGTEFTAHVGFMELFNQWLSGQSDFPLWNPIPGYGRSMITDPFSFAFNPFISAPMAVFGIVNGSKIAVLLHLLIAGLGVWFLSRLLGFGRPARVWCSLLYMLSGSIPAHLTVGQLQLSLSLCWLPWSVFGLIWALKSRSLIAAAGGAIAQALFFFSGNLYHQTFASFALLFIGISFAVDWKLAKFRARYVRRFVLVGALSLGLISIQLLPMVASASSMRNDAGFIRGDHTFPGSQLPQHAILNYLVSDHWFYLDPSLDKVAFLQESYRYVGIAPLLFLLFLVPAFRHGNRREIAAFAASFAFLVGWASLRYSLVGYVFDLFPILYEFRFPGRALSVGILFLVMLSGFGLNALSIPLGRTREYLSGTRFAEIRLIHRSIGPLAEVLLVVAIFGGIRSAFNANRELFYLHPVQPQEARQALDWLSEHQPAYPVVFASGTITENLTLDAYRQHIRLLSFVDGWRPAPAPSPIGAHGSLPIKPAIQLDWVWDPLDTHGYKLAYQVQELRIWQDPRAIPSAILVSEDQLRSSSPIGVDEIESVASYERTGFNSVEVDFEANHESILVIAESWFEGWRVTVDGEHREPIAVDDFLAVRVPAGRHSVIFEYAPLSFAIGSLISGVTLLAILGMVARPLLRRRLLPTGKGQN